MIMTINLALITIYLIFRRSEIIALDIKSIIDIEVIIFCIGVLEKLSSGVKAMRGFLFDKNMSRSS